MTDTASKAKIPWTCTVCKKIRHGKRPRTGRCVVCYFKANGQEAFINADGVLDLRPVTKRLSGDVVACPDCGGPIAARFPMHTCPPRPDAQTVAECDCEIVGKDAQGNPLPACKVLNFRYYGGRCKADG